MSLEERKPKIVIRSSDDKSLELEEAVAVQSEILKEAIERAKSQAEYHHYSDIPIILSGTIPGISFEILEKVNDYCKFHAVEVPMIQEAIDAEKRFDAQFVDVDSVTLFRLIQAAYDLNIKRLMNLTCRALAEKIENKSPEEIEKEFDIWEKLSV